MFNIGSIVTFKGIENSPQMVVTLFNTRDRVVDCIWFNTAGELQRAQFPAQFLRQLAEGTDSAAEMPAVR
ncbi:hypothetical protein Pan44_39100 [Caulifigura coniformis]|uniref:DUF2158 domain-containing protein n=1 Tax=Caulifigura coniformis TaxID=2527983 RepID=A0A517SIC4_9PLAN|nr:DUF2158 domain-containing protein [Caulifigura coniformis]QDT55862.1 hypothetical protein Pan44_39100 [Caulifigura coniformis]